MSADVAEVLSDSERTALAGLEERIAAGLKVFNQVGAALAVVRDSRLYRETHATFEDYCQERWGLSRSRGYQLIAAAATVAAIEAVSTIVDTITTESQARELTGLAPDVAAQVVETAAAAGPVTATALREARQVVVPPAPSLTRVAMHEDRTLATTPPRTIAEFIDSRDPDAAAERAGLDLRTRWLKAAQGAAYAGSFDPQRCARHFTDDDITCGLAALMSFRLFMEALAEARRPGLVAVGDDQ